MNSLIIILAAILPAFLLVVYIWSQDRYQHEPLSWMLRGVVYGVVSAGIAVVLEVLIQQVGLSPDTPATAWGALCKAFLGAAMPEELAKLLMFYLLIRRNPYFDERMDGIVYACCVGMGFAGTENIVYLLSNLDTWQSVAWSRAVFSVPGHFMFAVAMGYYFSAVYFGDMSARRWSRVFWVPVLLHGIFDGILFLANVGDSPWASLLLLVFYGFVFFLYRYGRRRIRQQLEQDRHDPGQIAFWR